MDPMGFQGPYRQTDHFLGLAGGHLTWHCHAQYVLATSWPFLETLMILVSVMLLDSGIAVVCDLNRDSVSVPCDSQYTYITSCMMLGGLELGE